MYNADSGSNCTRRLWVVVVDDDDDDGAFPLTRFLRLWVFYLSFFWWTKYCTRRHCDHRARFGGPFPIFLSVFEILMFFFFLLFYCTRWWRGHFPLPFEQTAAVSCHLTISVCQVWAANGPKSFPKHLYHFCPHLPTFCFVLPFHVFFIPSKLLLCVCMDGICWP